MLARVILLFVQTLFCLTAAAQTFDNFTTLTSAQGLSENNIRSVLQLPDGRMVFVNEGMVNIYNGATFKYLHLDEKLSYPLPGYYGHHRLYSDNSERLWMKRHGRLTLINLAKERNEPDLNSVFQQFGLSGPLSDFFMDADRDLWFIKAKGDIYLKKHAEKAAHYFVKLRQVSNADPITDISSYSNTVFFFLQSGAVVAYDINLKKEVYKSNSLDGVAAANYRGTTYVIRSKNQFYLLRNGKNGILLTFDIVAKSWKKVLDVPYTLNTLSVGPQGRVVVSVKSGIWSMQSDGSRLRYFPTLTLADGRKINTEISTATYDNQGGLWLGTLNKGLLYYNPMSYRLTEVKRNRFPADINKEINITSFAELSSAKALIIGTDYGAYKYDAETGSIQQWQAVPSNFNCYTINKDSKGSIWLGSDKGLFRYVNGGLLKISSLVSKKFLEDKNGNYYGLSIQNQLYKINPHTGQNTLLVLKVKGKPTNISAFDIIYNNETLYAISADGILSYNTVSKNVRLVHFKSNKTFNKLNNYHFSCIAIDPNNRIWFGTQDGLNVWDTTNNMLTELHSEDGLVNNDVKAILFDDFGDAWITTAYGISKIKVQGLKSNKIHFTNFTQKDGVISEQFNERTAFKLNSGQILVGGIDGFNLLDPSKNRISLPLKPIFTDLNVQGTLIKPETAYDGMSILNRSITSGGLITLKYNQNFFTVSFSGLNYANPSRTAYRYTLAGAQDNWHELEPLNGIGSATYTNLNPGKYRLLVQASGDGEHWSSPQSSLEITIKAPWWKTPYMIAIYCLAGIALLSGAVFYFNRRRSAKQLLLQEKRLNEMKFTFFTNVSHELRTPLTLIITPLGVILKTLDNLPLKKQLQGVYNNATHLLSMVDQLLDFRRLQTEKQGLHLTVCDLSESLVLLFEAFREMAELRKISLTINAPKHLWVYIDNEKFKIVVNNLLSNALKFTTAGGSVVIELSPGCFPNSTEKAAVIKVKDSGKGIPTADIAHILNRFFQAQNHLPGEMRGSGIGLSLVDEYVRLHGGVIDVESTIGQGSTFTIHLPFNSAIENQITTSSVTAQEEISSPAIKVLIAEDNTELRNLIGTQLRIRYHVIEAADGKQALNEIASNPPDIIISDLMMPEMDGLELCRAVKSDIHTSHLPFILLTAKGSEFSHLEGYQAKADAYITKPFNMDMLLLQVSNLLEMQERRKAMFKNSIIIPLHLASASEADEKFIKKLLDCIEYNMANKDYSVENLSSDMHMERSGLYRKVVAVTGQVPSIFIRTIRLKKAAQLLLLKQHSIAKVSEMTGFSSAAYFSKCFADEFSVKPSEYYTSQTASV